MNRRPINLIFLAVAVVATCTLADISAQQAQRNGEIAQIDADNGSFVVKTARGETQIKTTDETVYMRAEEKITFEDLKVGDSVQVVGARESDHVVATEVTVRTD